MSEDNRLEVEPRITPGRGFIGWNVHEETYYMQLYRVDDQNRCISPPAIWVGIRRKELLTAKSLMRASFSHCIVTEAQVRSLPGGPDYVSDDHLRSTGSTVGGDSGFDSGPSNHRGSGPSNHRGSGSVSPGRPGRPKIRICAVCAARVPCVACKTVGWGYTEVDDV